MSLASMFVSHLGIYQIVIPFIEDAIKSNPLDPDYYRMLGLTYGALEQDKESTQALLKSYELTDGRFNGDAGLIFGLISQGES